MLEASGQSELGVVNVFTSIDSGHSSEQIADMALNKIISVGETAPPEIRLQAEAYRNELKEILIYYLTKMAQSERTTIWALMKKQGHEDIAEIIRRL
jgi:hypothetical protein